MKNLCYNKATKRKKQTKKCFKLSKRGQTDEQIKHRQQERGLAGCRRDTAKD